MIKAGKFLAILVALSVLSLGNVVYVSDSFAAPPIDIVGAPSDDWDLSGDPPIDGIGDPSDPWDISDFGDFFDSSGSPASFSAGACGDNPTLGCVVKNIVDSSAQFPVLLAAISYMFGITLGVFGVIKLYEHVQNPHQTHLSEGLKRLLAGSLFLSLPIVVEAAYQTMNADNIDAVELSSFSGGVGGEGLDAMMQRLMADIHDPMDFALKSFCYVAGVVLIMIGISRLLKSSQEGPRGPGGAGTLMTFIVAGALLSVDAMMGAWGSSMFNSSTVANSSVLSYTGGMTAGEQQHVLGVISTMLIFMMILGWVSFIRGWFILRDVAEGGHNASMMAGITHLFGGALAVNLGPLMNAVQVTLGLTDYGVNFTM